ncbi:MAG TPA: GntP family permease [Candidatus Hydrogenedentes bacterium]|nr:GntP family permease [Candidatus Hydrogenedentota bacterium]
MIEGPSLIFVLLFAVGFIILATGKLKLHPFLVLLLASVLVGLLVGMPLTDLVDALNSGFGGILRHIGLVIVLGTIIGVGLEKSGAAIRMADSVIRLLGERRPQLAMSVVGAIVSVPVFCDSGFVILSSLNKAVAKRAKVSVASMSVALATGLYATHTLVPPTPGPIAAAGNIGASDYLGIVILMGFLVSIPTVFVGYLWAILAVGRIMAVEQDAVPQSSPMNSRDDALPSVWKSFAPIAVPVGLIGAGSVISFFEWEGVGAEIGLFLGAPVVALLTGLLFAVLLMPRLNVKTLNEWVGAGVKNAAPILLITGAGGAFGTVLSATPVAALIKGLAEGGLFDGPFVLALPFAIAVGLKTAQGSSTASLVATSALIAPFLDGMGVVFPVQRALVVMAIGAGAMTVSHANDSYFWVVTQFSGIEVKDAYKTLTFATLLQGITAFSAALLLYLMLV